MTTEQNSLTRRAALCATGALATLPIVGRARAQGAPSLKIGVVTDMSGPYRDIGGPMSIAAARQAIADYADPHGIKVEVLQGDHQNKPDVGAGIVREWIDQQGVDVVVDAVGTAVSLAVQNIVTAKNKVFLATAASSTVLTGANCSANSIQWTFDTYLLSSSTASAICKAGGKKWYIINADYQFGWQLRNDATAVVEKNGGTLVGGSAYPFPQTSDFSSLLLTAQSSGADVCAFANGGADTANSVKQANEFGLGSSMKLVALQMLISDVNAIGLAGAAGFNLTETFYWDLNDGTRAFSEKMKARVPDTRPGMLHAGAYSATLHYLKTAQDMGIADAKVSGRAMIARMKVTPSDDECFGKCAIRADGRRLMPAYLFQVKTPAESKGPWDYYKLIATTPADQVARPLADGKCPLIGPDGSMRT
jgi:branched-chain amino acid transport system substrate-binding protein